MVLALAIVAIASGAAWMSSAQPPDAVFVQDGWGSEATLQVRTDRSGGLLFAPGIRYVDPPANARRHDAYRYESGKTQLTPLPASAWNAAEGAIVDCDRAGLATSVVTTPAGELQIEGRRASVSGVRHARISPDKRVIAVVTGSGMSTPSASSIPTLGGRGLVGWRYHRLISTASGAPVGEPVGLGFGVADPAPCWGPDGRTVIYADPAFTRLMLVRVSE